MVNNPKRKPGKVKAKLPLNTDIKALIYLSNDKNPEVVTIKKYADDFFNHNGRSYKIDFEDVMFFKKSKLLWGSSIYLFYHYDNDQPLRVDDKLRSVSNKRIPNTVIYTALQSDAIRKAHDMKKDGLLDGNMTYIMIAGAIMVALYFMFGG